MLCEYQHTKSESLVHIYAKIAAIRIFILVDRFLLTHPVGSAVF